MVIRGLRNDFEVVSEPIRRILQAVEEVAAELKLCKKHILSKHKLSSKALSTILGRGGRPGNVSAAALLPHSVQLHARKKQPGK